MFMCGGYEEFYAVLAVVPKLIESFKTGGGVPQSDYPQEFWNGLRRVHRRLAREPPGTGVDPSRAGGQGEARGGLPLCRRRLRARGWPSSGSPRRSPSSTFVGYDAFEGQLAGAEELAAAGGCLRPRELRGPRRGARGCDEKFDVISTFDVVHDAVDPVGLLKGIRSGLADDGHYLLLDINCADDPVDNQGPLAALFYGFSVTYCMTTSLANGGAGLGTCGLPPAKASELTQEAGFSSCEKLPLENPFNNLFDVRP